MSDTQTGTMTRDRDLVLPPNTYAYVLDSTKGRVNVHVGPDKNSLSNTDQLVVWDTALHRFVQVNDVARAVSVFQMAGEGQYVVLNNPASNALAGPPRGTSTEAVDLDVGRQVNVPGPVAFPLWPGQTAQTIDGHHLRHNQYLIVRVYDPEQAQANWERAVVAPQVGTDGTATGVTSTAPRYAMGQLIVVVGTEVSFYIPPTGIEVVPEGGTVTNGVMYGGTFVREAVTLERLEYCILLDENGEKRYLQGPDVVFPHPTETFVVGKEGNRKFRAIELNEHSGLYIKVIAEYQENGITHPVGEELFITGAEQAIYFPCAEHSLIMYGDKRVHHAVAIPAGEGRYVLDRDKGTVDLVNGPKMFLPDPRTQVVVLRILDPHVVQLLFPGNTQALEVNESYAALSTRLGAGEHLSNAGSVTASYAAVSSPLRGVINSAPVDTMRRGSTYSAPRNIVLDTKYEGAVTINIWPGYAVLVVDKSDNRRVEVGPKAIMLQYDESLMPLTLSTGRPKQDKNLLRTAYLRIINNQVSDRVTVETRDLVSVAVDLSYLVNFEADKASDQERWFAIENYVKVLTDAGRSRLRNAAKRHGIQEFYTNTIDIIRDTLLGESVDGARTGMTFSDNGMKLTDVEVLDVKITDMNVGALLLDAQTNALEGAIKLSTAEETAVREKRLEELKRSSMDEYELTSVKEGTLMLSDVTRSLDLRMATIHSELQATEESMKVQEEIRQDTAKHFAQEINFSTARNEVEVARLVAETTEHLRSTAALTPNLVDAMQLFGDKSFVEKLVQAVGPAAMATGVTSADLFGQIFKGTPFDGVMGALTHRPLARTNGPSSVRVPVSSE